MHEPKVLRSSHSAGSRARFGCLTPMPSLRSTIDLRPLQSMLPSRFQKIASPSCLGIGSEFQSCASRPRSDDISPMNEGQVLAATLHRERRASLRSSRRSSFRLLWVASVLDAAERTFCLRPASLSAHGDSPKYLACNCSTSPRSCAPRISTVSRLVKGLLRARPKPYLSGSKRPPMTLTRSSGCVCA